MPPTEFARQFSAQASKDNRIDTPIGRPTVSDARCCVSSQSRPEHIVDETLCRRSTCRRIISAGGANLRSSILGLPPSLARTACHRNIVLPNCRKSGPLLANGASHNRFPNRDFAKKSYG